jgi:hypothetical protein
MGESPNSHRGAWRDGNAEPADSTYVSSDSSVGHAGAPQCNHWGKRRSRTYARQERASAAGLHTSSTSVVLVPLSTVRRQAGILMDVHSALPRIS